MPVVAGEGALLLEVGVALVVWGVRAGIGEHGSVVVGEWNAGMVKLARDFEDCGD